MFTEMLNEKGKVFLTLSRYPTKGMTLRELSRISGVSLGKVSEIIREFLAKDIIVLEKYGKTYVIKLNMENDIVLKLKRIFNIAILLFSEIIEDLKKCYPKAIVLFGSFEKGLDNENSDIDIAVISEVSPKIESLIFFERKIQIHHFRNESEISKELKNSIANGIVLEGFFEVIE